MAEVLASLKKIGGSGEQYTETVLWTNPSPSSTFAAQTITLSDSLNNYKYIGIRFAHDTSYSTGECISTLLQTVADFRKGGYNTGVRRNNVSISDSNASNTAYSRMVMYVNDTSVRFGTCYQVASNTQANANNIPLEILGINELAHKTTIAMDLIGEVSLPANTATVTCTTTQNISDYKNLFITSAEYNGSALVTTSVATPPLQFVDTEYFASNSVTGYYAAGSTLTSYAITMQKLSDTSIQFTRPTASGTRQVYVYGIK